MTLCDVGARNLRAQILRQTIVDWHMAMREIERRKNNTRSHTNNHDRDNIYENPQQTLDDIGRFCRSRWFGILYADLDVDGEQMYKAMQSRSALMGARGMEKWGQA